MIIDCGFWDINGDYIEDYRELNEIEAQEVLRKPKRKENSIIFSIKNPNCYFPIRLRVSNPQLVRQQTKSN